MIAAPSKQHSSSSLILVIMQIDTGSLKRAVRSMRIFSRKRLLASFHLASSISEKHAIPASDHAKLQELFAPSTTAFDSPAEQFASAPVPPSTDAANSASLLSTQEKDDAQSICLICGNFDPRPHINDGRRATGHYRRAGTPQDGAAATRITNSLSLPFSLLWEAEPHGGHGTNRPNRCSGRTPSEHCLPSWSTTSVSCPVSYGDLEGPQQSMGTGISEALCQVLKVSCELASPFISHDSDRSTLTIQGFLCELQCRVDPSSDRVELAGPSSCPRSGKGFADWSITMAHDVLPPRSVAKDWVDVKERLVFLPIILRQQTPCWESEHGARHALGIKGLALRRVAGTSNLCTRIGTVNLRFRTSDDEGKESWQYYLGCVATGGEDKIVTII
ncbi:hypothetical protein B0T14DRAFT_201594 [Immersiella caudata]|uniref:Uncharacterized protein n=1 Tax=Immersiella caudata TaxID=314043 RepID=A0AA39WPG1_9PEZI|nr:hypothetical protein B0T14DRAFT_201594 [Immersiella caudata]